MAVNAQRELCALTKSGGLALDMDEIAACCEVAFAKYDALFEIIQAQVKEDLNRRDIRQSSLHGRDRGKGK